MTPFASSDFGKRFRAAYSRQLLCTPDRFFLGGLAKASAAQLTYQIVRPQRYTGPPLMPLLRGNGLAREVLSHAEQQEVCGGVKLGAEVRFSIDAVHPPDRMLFEHKYVGQVAELSEFAEDKLLIHLRRWIFRRCARTRSTRRLES